MLAKVRRVFNLQPFVGQYNTYETQQELEYDETKINSKLVNAYLNNLVEEQFIMYLLQCVELSEEQLEYYTERFKVHTKNRIKYYNKIFRTGEN